LQLGADARFTPQTQLTADEFGPLSHSRQPVVPFAATLRKGLRVDALTVIRYNQSKCIPSELVPQPSNKPRF